VSQEKHQMVFNIETGGKGNSKRGSSRMTDIDMKWGWKTAQGKCGDHRGRSLGARKETD